MSHVWMSHVTHVKYGWHAHAHDVGWVMSHIWMTHVTYMDESCHMYEGVMSHVWISHVTHIKCSWCAHTNVVLWVISRIWMRHVTHMNQSRHTHEWVMSQRWSAADVHTHMILYASYHTHTITCDSFVCVWHGSFVCVTWCMHISRIQYHFYESYHIYACVMSHIRISHVTHIRMSHVTHVKCSCHAQMHTRTISKWVMSHLRKALSHVTHVNQSCLKHEWVTSHTWSADMNRRRWTQCWMGHVTHMNESCHTREGVMPHRWSAVDLHTFLDGYCSTVRVCSTGLR